jgi:predicted nuclease of restriction endonuclease-like (RecB) superfamily
MLMNNAEYFEIVEGIKTQIRASQYKAVVGANKELLTLYWNIGKVILENRSWGNKFVENLSKDIRADFPNATGYSIRNLKYMQKFAATYPDLEFVQSVTAQIPWTHNKSVLDKVKEKGQMQWYISKTAENGWRVEILEHQIDTKLYDRQILAEKTTNYTEKLPAIQSELALQTLKDPYWFDFIETKEKMIEREIESEMVANVSKLLLELGTGFGFHGNHYHLEVGGNDYYLDLLFYNSNLHCYFVIELKAGAFKPEYAGKLNFYL